MSAFILTRLEIQPDKVSEALALFREMSDDVAANEPGTQHYAFRRDERAPEVFWCYQVYVDDAARTEHLGRHGHRGRQFEAVLAEPPAMSLLSLTDL